MPTWRSGAIFFASLYTSEAIFPSTISCASWSSVRAAAFSFMILSMIVRRVFSCDVLILERVKALTATRSLYPSFVVTLNRPSTFVVLLLTRLRK